MADSVTMKQDDTRPKLIRNLRQTIDGTPTWIPLDSASKVDFAIDGAGTVLTRSASIVTAAQGLVCWVPTTGDTPTAGSFNCEWIITWNDSGIETVPNSGFFTLTVEADVR